MSRYIFILPDVTHPVGGINVALRMVDELCDAGYDAIGLFGRKANYYKFYEITRPTYYRPEIHAVARRINTRWNKFYDQYQRVFKRTPISKNTLLALRSDDVFVLPEFWYPEFAAEFPKHQHVLLAQDVLGFCRAYSRDAAGTRQIDRLRAICATSEAAKGAVKVFAKKESHFIPQGVCRPSLTYSAQKKRQIAYMPRKRPQEVKIVTEHLRRHSAFKDWSLFPIQHATPAELDEILGESLIFLSFSHQEGFGLPPAEAMATGSIVIGYTGVGGDEYFTSDYGIPVPDSDLASFVRSVEATITEYDQDPARLDAMRKAASDMIHTRYSLEAMRAALLEVWGQIDSDINGS